MAPIPTSRCRGFQFQAEELDNFLDIVENFLPIGNRKSQIFAICYGWAQISGTVTPKESNWQQRRQRRQQRSGTTIPLAQQGCVTGVVVVIIIVLVTALAYVAEAVPGHVIAKLFKLIIIFITS